MAINKFISELHRELYTDFRAILQQEEQLDKVVKEAKVVVKDTKNVVNDNSLSAQKEGYEWLIFSLLIVIITAGLMIVSGLGA